FFFASRRRHTSSKRDWSSDVCSSDLSAGYGEAFRKANYRKLGLGDYEDVITGVDSLIEKGWVDSKQVGIMGWSQGGYISAFCAKIGRASCRERVMIMRGDGWMS